MNSLDEHYGYDANFISEVSESLKCIVCHLVMRQPVQLMVCGHRFCKSCFERLQGYATHLNTQLCCPIDRHTVDISKVFDDTAVSRDIGNLHVICSYAAFGCSWKGDLRNLMEHEKECQHQMNENVPNQNQVGNTVLNENIRLVAELSKRVQSCESTLNEKEKDLDLIKRDIHEMKRKYDKKENEVADLKKMNDGIFREMSRLREVNYDLREYVKREVKKLEKRYEKLEDGLEDCLDSLDLQTKDVKTVVGKAKSLDPQIKSNGKIIKEDKDLFAPKKHLERFKTSTTNEIDKLKTQINMNRRQLEKFERNMPAILPFRLENNSPINENFLQFKNRLESIERLHATFREDAIHHLENIENVMFCHQPYLEEKNVKVRFKWAMKNFQRNYDSGKKIYSPIFYTSLQGYCFKLSIEWSGNDRENLGLFLWICRDEHTPVEQDKDILDPFRIQYILEIHDKDGHSIEEFITFAHLDEYRESCFTILPNKKETIDALGEPKMLHKSTWNDYVINDMMYITCTFLNH